MGHADRRRKYPINHAAFDVESDETAYWTGLLYADGGLARIAGSWRIRLTLQAGDKGILEELAAFVGSPDRPIGCTADGRNSVLTFNSRRIFERLESLGVVRNKTYVGKGATVSWLAESRDFWRGVVDGDGCVATTPKGKPRLHLAADGHLMTQFFWFTHAHVDTDAALCKQAGIIQMALKGRPARDMLRVLYQDATVALARKADKARLLAQWEPVPPENRWLYWSKNVGSNASPPERRLL